MTMPVQQGIPETATPRQPRYSQLIYMSFDNGSGIGGGWQIKDEEGGFTAAEREILTARICTPFEVDPPLPAFPTPDQIALRPARLSYATLQGDRAGYWHTVDAGIDATGRPGNVAAHVVLDRATSAPAIWRPIELWGSPGWLRPYGPAQVRAATVTGNPLPAPSGDLTVASIVRFLVGTDIDRQSVFRVLLDAVHHALEGGPKVVLLTEDAQSGPLWIAAVSFMMSPGTARRFGWTTHDHPDGASADWLAGHDLVICPRRHAAAVAADTRITVLDEIDEPSLGEPGAHHITAYGEVPVTAWSTLAEGVLGDELLAEQLLARQDTIAAQIGDYGLSPIWPLAVAVREHSPLREFHTDADHVIVDDAPPAINSVPELQIVVNRAEAATAPTDPAAALDRLTRAAARQSSLPRAAHHLVKLALQDPAWNDAGLLEAVPYLPVVAFDTLMSTFTSALPTLLAANTAAPGRALGAVLHLAELISRLAVPDNSREHAFELLIDLLTSTVLQQLWDIDSAQAVLSDRTISTSTKQHCLRPAIGTQPAAVLAQLPIESWRWIFDEPADSSALEIPADPSPADSVLYPHYVLAELSTASPRISSEHATRVAAEALYLALDVEDIDAPTCRTLVAALNTHAHLNADELLDIFSRWPHRISPGAAVTAILYENPAPEFIAALAALGTHDEDPNPERWASVTVNIARLRALLIQTDRPISQRVSWELERTAPAIIEVLQPHHIDDIAGELVDVVTALIVVAQSISAPLSVLDQPRFDAYRRRLKTRREPVVDLLSRWAIAGVLDTDWIIGQSLLARTDGSTANPPSLLTTASADPHQRTLADEVALSVATHSAYELPTSCEALRDCAWPTVRTLTAAQADDFFASYPRAARKWLTDLRADMPVNEPNSQQCD